MTSHGPGPGVRSRVAEQRARMRALAIESKSGVSASHELVARLVAAKAFFELKAGESIRLNLGDGAQEYGPGDIDVLLAECAESYSRYDTAGEL